MLLPPSKPTWAYILAGFCYIVLFECAMVVLAALFNLTRELDNDLRKVIPGFLVLSLPALFGIQKCHSVIREYKNKKEQYYLQANIRNILKIAEKKKGRITVNELISGAFMTTEEVEATLHHLLSSGACEKKVGKNGMIFFYHFPEFESDDAKSEDFS